MTAIMASSQDGYPRFADTSHEIHRQWQRQRMRTFPSVAAAEIPPSTPAHGYDPTTAHIAAKSPQMPLTIQPRPASKSPRPRGTNDTMDLSYVTERIIALWFPTEVNSAVYRQGQQQAANMLRTKHGNNYMVFNLSEPRRAAHNHHRDRIRELGWPPNLAPPLERLCAICKDIDSWLSGDSHRIAVIHARGSRERIGVVIAAYMHYSSICGSTEQALDRFAMKRFLDDKVGDFEQPSHKRYVEYFSGLLSGSIRINSAPLYLTHVTVLGAPFFETEDSISGCRAFLKVYEGLVPVYTSGVHTVGGETRQFTVNVAGERQRRGLQLRGDVLVKCYHRYKSSSAPASPGTSTVDRPLREVIFTCQFHTCAVSDYTLSFTRQELDTACTDLRFPLDGAVELHFSPTPEVRLPSPAPTPAVLVDHSDDPVTRYDSYQNLTAAESPLDADTDGEDVAGGDEVDLSHTHGPLDGSLYATISKKQQQEEAAERAAASCAATVVGSPFTVSMDSGISSAGNGLAVKKSHNTSNESASPSYTTTTTTREEQHRTLDELLSDMLLTVENIPDLPSSTTSPYGHRHSSTTSSLSSHSQRQLLAGDLHGSSPRHTDVIARSASTGHHHNGFSETDANHGASLVFHDLDDVNFIDAEVDADNIPYHARQDSRPFTYGPVPASPSITQPNTMMRLASPSLVRKASFSNGEEPSRATYNGGNTSSYKVVTPPVFDATPLVYDAAPIRSKPVVSPLKSPPLDYIDSEVLSSPVSDYLNGSSSTSPRSPEFHDGSIIGVSSVSNLTWLQRQQQKLRERQSGQLTSERYPSERRLITELQTLQHHSYKRMLRPSASHRDGYTSDTTHFADDEDFTTPLHVNVAPAPVKSNGSAPASPHRKTSRRNYGNAYVAGSSGTSPLGRQRSESSFDRERPFVAVKRAHEQNGRVHQASPYAIEPVSPGLLTMVEEMQQQQQQQQQRGSATTNQPHQDALSSLIASLAASSSANSSASTAWHPSQLQDESFSSWRSTSTSEDPGSPPRSSSPRPQTPAFPVHPRTPYANNSTPYFDSNTTGLPPKSPTAQRKEYSSSPLSEHPPSFQRELSGGSRSQHNGSSSPTVYTGQSRRSSIHSNSEPAQEVSAAHVKFVRDTSRYWYKPSITREDAISMLRDQQPGTFVVRDSNSFPGAFGLALKVATAPPTPQGKTADPGNELVRHFLIEPTSRGVKLKGCSNEPVFSSLSALVYQHSLTAMALPCLLALPEVDSSRVNENAGSVSSAQLLLAQGAACNVLYLFTTDCESLTGPEAIKKAVQGMFQTRPLPHAIVVHFKVSGQGITLTDSKRQLFFRRHYPTNTISHCSLDPDDHRWSQKSDETGMPISSNRCFGFVARKSASKQASNQCHIFAELEPEQPASAIVNFVCKVIMSTGTLKANIV